MTEPNTNRPDQKSKDLEAYWLKKFEESARKGSDAQRNIGSDIGHVERIRVFKELIQKNLPKDVSSVLDVGCGSGTYFEIYKSLSLDIRGIDYSQAQLDIAKQRFPNAKLHAGLIETAPANLKADLVVTIGVIQVVSDLSSFLASLAARVTEGGIAIASCLNKHSIWPGSILDPNLTFYSYKQISNSLETHFEIIDFRRFYPLPFPANLARDLLYRHQIPFLNHGLMFVLKPRES